MKDTLFALTNIIQFGVVINVITPPITCYTSCIASTMIGLMILPCFMTMNHIVKKQINWICKSISIIIMTFVPLLVSFGANFALDYCYDENWFVWSIQGAAIPGMFWSTYRMFFNN